MCELVLPTAALAYSDHNGHDFCVVFAQDQLTPARIAHEVVHLVNMIFQYVDYKPDLSNDEAQAYLHQYIFEEIFTALFTCEQINHD